MVGAVRSATVAIRSSLDAKLCETSAPPSRRPGGPAAALYGGAADRAPVTVARPGMVGGRQRCAAATCGRGLGGGALGWCKDGLGSAMEGQPRLAGVAHRPEPGHEPTDLPRAARQGRRAARQCQARHHRRAVRGRQPARCSRRCASSAAAGSPCCRRPPASRARRARRRATAFAPTASPRRSCALDKDNYRTAAFDPELVALLERYGSFYFTGGDQALIVQALIQDGRPTPALAAIRRRLGGGRAGLRQQCRGRDHERPDDHQRQLGRGAGPPAGARAARHPAQHRPRPRLLPARAGRPALPAARAAGAAGGGAAGDRLAARLRHRREHRHGDRRRPAARCWARPG